MTNEEILYKINRLDDIQRSEIEEHIEMESIADDLNNIIKEEKERIYNKYASDISESIAQIEIYAHDLPRQISGLIETIFDMLAIAAAENNEDDNKRWYTYIWYQVSFLEDLLNLYLVDLYVKQVRKYRKIFKKFNHQGVKVQNDFSLLSFIDSKMKEIKKLSKSKKRSFKKKYGLNEFYFRVLLNKRALFEHFIKKDFHIKANVDGELLQVKRLADSANELVSLCEDNFANVINNGYNSSVIKKIWNFLLQALPLGLAVYGVIQLIMGKVK